MPILKQREVARRWGVAAATVCEWARPGGPLAAARVGTRLDTDHPAVTAFITGRAALKPTKRTHHFPESVVQRAVRGGDLGPTEEHDGRGFPHFEEVADLTLRQIAEKFHGDERMTDYVRLWDLYEGSAKKRLSNDARRATLLDVNLLRRILSAFLVNSHQGLLQTSRLIAERAFELAQQGCPVEEANRMVSEAFTAVLRQAKQKALDELRDVSD